MLGVSFDFHTIGEGFFYLTARDDTDELTSFNHRYNVQVILQKIGGNRHDVVL